MNLSTNINILFDQSSVYQYSSNKNSKFHKQYQNKQWYNICMHYNSNLIFDSIINNNARNNNTINKFNNF